MTLGTDVGKQNVNSDDWFLFWWERWPQIIISLLMGNYKENKYTNKWQFSPPHSSTIHITGKW